MDGSEGQYVNERPRWQKKRWFMPALVVLALVIMAVGAWNNRIDIADGYLSDQLEASGLPATYDIERIGGQTQIISNLVIGDPGAPDFTAERVIVRLKHRFGLPQVGGVTIVKPRIYGRYIDGQLSFGSLDSLLFDESSDAPSMLPDIDLAIRDGRGLIESDFGPVGLKLAGEGNLISGFAGKLAATAPQLDVADCRANGATLFGEITTLASKPRFIGPVRMEGLACPESELSVSDVYADLDLALDEQLSDPSLVAQISSDAARLGSNGAQSLAGTLRAQMRDETMTARYSLAARGVDTPQALAAILTAEGRIRAQDSFARFEIEGDIEGNGLRMGPSLVAGLQSLQGTGDGTLVEPIALRIGNALQSQTRGSALAASLRYRSDQEGYALIVPQAELAGGSGARIISVSRMEVTSRGGAAPQFSGNVATAGPGIPRISGRMESAAGGDALFRLTMAPYKAGGSQIAVPNLVIAQGGNGTLGFSGEVIASGPVPGGAIDQLRVPLKGRWTGTGKLVLWRECTRFGFRRVAFADLNLAGSGLTLCPQGGAPILQYGESGLRIAARSENVDLEGSLGDTPIAIDANSLSVSYPGQLAASDVEIALGSAGDTSRFAFGQIDARLGDTVEGTISEGEVALAAVPMNLQEVAGNFRFADGRLSLDDGAFRLLDREDPARFEPLVARSASLSFTDNIIDAEAALRNPASDRLVTRVDIRHDLSSGAGFADLDIPGLKFDDVLQPVNLSELAKGVIANAEGVITGEGRIEWSPAGEVTSAGSFSSDNLDFAAAFGPVKGASGTVEFTDLLNLTTAPDQTIRVASVNPGIEVLDGEVTFSLENGELLAVQGGSWPFMGGRLILREVDLNLGVSEARSYIFEIVGLDASQFVAQMELENISATGRFDGTIPIIFDRDGNGRIEEGILLSRPPGGNISYVGELTYEDLSAIANFAFDALRSLDYSQMRIVMNGPLTGEIVTEVRFDGVRQGEGAKSNFITRQLADLPLQFRINIKAQFYQLITSLKAMYDPSSVRDPRELGLLSDDGTRLLRRSITGEEVEPDIDPADVIPDEPPIQDQESE